MRMPNDYDERPGMTPTMVMTIVAVTFFVAVILIMVLLLNKEERGGNIADKTQSQSSSPIIVDSESGFTEDSQLRPEDLDFWDRYPPKETEKPADTPPPKEVVENDPSTDGKHTRVVNPDGSEEWVLISSYLPKHDYDFTQLVCQSNIMKYYENQTQVSYEGIDLSEVQDYVDFAAVKKSGIDFVMLRLGSRGYSTGQLVLDDYFSDNLKRATDAGLDVGVYFYSQAISVEEAEEEANMVIEHLGDHRISYPVAYDMERILSDTARTDVLGKTERTAIAKKFMDTIKEAGYQVILYGNKEWLLKQVDLSKLTAYDVWLSQVADIPDYPYRFTMWQYNTSGKVDGVSGYVNLNISFIDYSER